MKLSSASHNKAQQLDMSAVNRCNTDFNSVPVLSMVQDVRCTRGLGRRGPERLSRHFQRAGSSSLVAQAKYTAAMTIYV